MFPAISICIPAYKQPECLKRLLNSIDQQSFRDFEVIITDDSPDDCLHDVIFKSSWSFSINYFKNPTALGSPENWNEAIRKANGTWIKLMHHDDWFADFQSLQGFYDTTIINTTSKFFFCNTLIYDTITHEQYMYQPNQTKLKNLNTVPAELFHANLIGAPTTTFIHKDAIMSYNTSLIWLVDIEFYIRMMKKWGIVNIQKALIVTSANQEHQLTTSLLNNKEVELREYFYCYNLFKKQFNRNNRVIFIRRTLNLLRQFEVDSIDEIKATGYKETIPTFVKLYCILASFNTKFATYVLEKWFQLD